MSLITVANAEDSLMDTREGEDLTLKCRFSEQHLSNDFSYYWARVSGTNYENVAIGQVQLSANYRYVDKVLTIFFLVICRARCALGVAAAHQ